MSWLEDYYNDEHSFSETVDMAKSSLIVIDKKLYLALKADLEERTNQMAKDKLLTIVQLLRYTERLSKELQEDFYDSSV